MGCAEARERGALVVAGSSRPHIEQTVERHALQPEDRVAVDDARAVESSARVREVSEIVPESRGAGQLFDGEVQRVPP